MKKYFAAVVFLFMHVFMCAPAAHAQQPFDIGVCQRNASNVNCLQMRYLHFPNDGSDCIAYLKGSVVLPDCAAIGSGLSLVGGVLSATAADFNTMANVPATFPPSPHYQPFSSITGTPTTCSGYGITDCFTATEVAAIYFPKPSCPTTQYLRGDGSCATFPTIPAAAPTINRAIITTASDGTYTWTFPTACSSTAIVSVTPQNNTSAEVINHKVTAVSSTSVSIALSRAVLTLNGLLGITIPVIQTSPGAQSVHLIAVCP